MMIKELVKRIVLGKRYSSETFTKYLRSRGVRIGEDVTFFVPSHIRQMLEELNIPFTEDVASFSPCVIRTG